MDFPQIISLQSWFDIWVITAVLSTFALLGFTVYQHFFHPLACHSGPFIAKFSTLLNWYHASKGDRHEWILRLHSRYGPIVRFASNSLSFNSTEAVEDIYHSRKAFVIKSDWYQCVRDSASGFESTFTAREKHRHAIKRRLLSHAFSERALKDYEPRIANLVRRWLDCLQNETHQGLKSINMGDWSNYLVFDILGDLCFGKAFGALASEEERSIVGLVPQVTGSWYHLGYHPLSPLYRHLLFKTRLGAFIGGKSYQDNAHFRQFCFRTLKERKMVSVRETKSIDEAGSKDMFYHLLNGRDPETGQGYTQGDLACESVLLIVAGSQSTSGGLASTLFYLSHNPSALKRLTTEIRTAFESEAAIRYDANSLLASLPFLRAVLDESMRLSPPTPGHLPREVKAPAGLSIGNTWVPQGTIVGVSPYAIQRNEAYFPDPSHFRPERWLGSDTTQISSAFIPFSAGQTGCIGRQLAMMELSLAVALLLFRFDLSLDQSSLAHDGKILEDTNRNDEFRVKDCFVGEGNGPQLRLSLARDDGKIAG